MKTEYSWSKLADQSSNIAELCVTLKDSGSVYKVESD